MSNDQNSMLPDLRTLGDMAKGVADWAVYIERAGQLHVSNLQMQIAKLEDEAAILDQEHRAAIEAVHADYGRKKERNLAMRQDISQMVSFYLKDGEALLVAPDVHQPVQQHYENHHIPHTAAASHKANWLRRVVGN